MEGLWAGGLHTAKGSISPCPFQKVASKHGTTNPQTQVQLQGPTVSTREAAALGARGGWWAQVTPHRPARPRVPEAWEP